MKFLLLFLLLPLACQIPTLPDQEKEGGDTTEPVTRPAGMPPIDPIPK